MLQIYVILYLRSAIKYCYRLFVYNIFKNLKIALTTYLITDVKYFFLYLLKKIVLVVRHRKNFYYNKLEILARKCKFSIAKFYFIINYFFQFGI
jgi:hypothetical protein